MSNELFIPLMIFAITSPFIVYRLAIFIANYQCKIREHREKVIDVRHKSFLKTLREEKGLHSYPNGSRTK